VTVGFLQLDCRELTAVILQPERAMWALSLNAFWRRSMHLNDDVPNV
jgi:hypothetical protein